MNITQFPIVTMQVFSQTLAHANSRSSEMDLVLIGKTKKKIWRE